MKFCEKCGNKLEEGVLFCNKCGAKIEKKEKKAVKEEKDEEIASPPVRPIQMMPTKKGRGLSIFLTITSIILLATTITFLVLWLVKSSSCSGSGKGGKERTVEYLFDQYVKGYTTADFEAFSDAFPSFYINYLKVSSDKDIQVFLNNSKERYGNDFTIKYKIDKKTKISSSELDDLNETLTYRYDTNQTAKECYLLNGSITFTGSTYSDTDPIDDMYYCDYDGIWYLIG